MLIHTSFTKSIFQFQLQMDRLLFVIIELRNDSIDNNSSPSGEHGYRKLPAQALALNP